MWKSVDEYWETHRTAYVDENHMTLEFDDSPG
jgi:hypothetical protein